MELDNIKDKRLYVMLAKNNPCCDCGKKYHYSQMHFDHLPEFEKQHNIGSGKTIKTLEVLKEEIKKCDLLCANCHSKRTFLRLIGEDKKELLKDKDLNNLSNEEIVKYYKDGEKIRRSTKHNNFIGIKNEKNK